MIKKLLLAFPLILCVCSVTAQSFDFRLNAADSLFAQRQYTQSLEIYKQIFDESAYSPAMLLKMAYVEEGLGQTAMSLYYLNIYYRLTRDDRALEKMEQTATAYQLKGYEITPFDRFLLFLTVYQFRITGILAIATLLFGIATFLTSEKAMSRFLVVAQFVFAAALLFMINIDFRQDAAIVSKSPTYIMSGPSSGSNVVAVVSAGHRLDVNDRRDVWVKVEWEGVDGWVKESVLLTL
jgi:hypothetical protein